MPITLRNFHDISHLNSDSSMFTFVLSFSNDRHHMFSLCKDDTPKFVVERLRDWADAIENDENLK